MLGALRQFLQVNNYNAQHLGFSSTSAKAGFALFAGYAATSLTLSEEQKNKLAQKCVNAFHTVVDQQTVTESELRQYFWRNLISCENIVIASPAFYFPYYLIHKAKPTHPYPTVRAVFVSHLDHVAKSALKGLSGTAASTPALAMMYGVAAFAMPAFQSLFMSLGDSREGAAEKAPIALLAMAPIDFAVEALGCGVKRSQVTIGFASVASTLIIGRSVAGVLQTYNATDPNADHSPEAANKRLYTSIIGTSINQHGINAIMQAMSQGYGWKGVANYLVRGTASGNGSLFIGGLYQAGKTIGQRCAYMYAWNSLSDMERNLPLWATGKV